MTPTQIQTRPTPLGSVVLWVSLAVTLVGVARISAPLLLIGLLILGIWLTCRALAKRHLLGLRASRSLPSRAWVGRSFAIEGTLENESKARPANAFRFSDPLAVSRERKERDLHACSEVSLSYAARIHRRGRQRPNHWSVLSHWPLGWFESVLHDDFSSRPSEDSSILVLPDPFLPAQLQDHIEGSLSVAAHCHGFSDPTAEFRLLREFRSGDPVRGIHWPASLRTGGLLVREPDPPQPIPSRYGIVIHSYQAQREIVTPETFEMILRIAAGLLYRFREAGIEILFQQVPAPLVRLRYREDFDRALDQLALIFRSPLSTLEPLLNTAPLFKNCDEVFLLGDTPRSTWQAELSKSFGRCSCIDSSSLSLAARPTVKRSSLPA